MCVNWFVCVWMQKSSSLSLSLLSEDIISLVRLRRSSLRGEPSWIRGGGGGEGGRKERLSFLDLAGCRSVRGLSRDPGGPELPPGESVGMWLALRGDAETATTTTTAASTTRLSTGKGRVGARARERVLPRRRRRREGKEREASLQPLLTAGGAFSR